MEYVSNLLMILISLQIPIFLVALGGGLLGPMWLNSGQVDKARWALRIGFGASSLLVAIYACLIIFAVKTGNSRGLALDVLMAGLWSFLAYRDYVLLRRIGGK